MITVVSCFYHIDKSKFDISKYVYWMINFFKIKTNKIIFTDQKTFDYLFKQIKVDNLEFVIYDIEDFKVSQDYNLEQWWKHYIMDPEQSYHSIELYKIWNEKSNFIKKAIELDKFNSSYFYYCDIGCFRDNKVMNKYINWPSIEKVSNQKVGTKFTMLNVFPFTEEELDMKDEHDLFKFKEVNRIGGGIIGGSKEICLEWHRLFYEMMDKYFDENKFAGKDQSIMASAYIQLFNQDNKKCNEFFNLVTPKNPFTNPWFYLQEYLH